MLLFPVQGLAGYRPLVMLLLYDPREFVAASSAPAAPIHCLPWLQVAFALHVGVPFLHLALALLCSMIALVGHLSSQLRICGASALTLRHWPRRPCRLVTSSWLRPLDEDSFVLLRFF